MQKKNLALALSIALGALASPAFAQSSVTVYGIVDGGLVREQGGVAGASTTVSSGMASASRYGFRGSEDLGQGWSANFVLEGGARIDTGAVDTAGSIFNRQAFVGIKSRQYGALTLGRQYTPYYLALSIVGDPFGAGLSGSAKNLFPTAGSNTRTSNTVAYVSPVFGGGFTTELGYALGEQQGDSSAGRQVGAAVHYTTGKLVARLAHNNRNNDLTAAAGAAQSPPVPAATRGTGKNTLIAANYDFGFLKAFGAYGINKGFNSSPLPNNSNPFGGVRPTASTDSHDILLGATIPWSGHTIIVSLIDKDDRTVRNQDARQWAVGLTHALSKRSLLYTSYGKISNQRGAGYTVGNNSDVGTGDTAFNLGVRHSF
jgi:GBP family porin